MVSATLRIAVTGVASLTSGVIVLAFFQDRLVTVIAVALISVGFSILNQVRTYFLMAGPPRPLLAWVLVFRLLYCSGQAPSAWAYSALSRYISVRAPFSGCRRCFCPWYLSQAQSATPGSCKAPKDRPSYQKAPQCSACNRAAVQGVVTGHSAGKAGHSAGNERRTRPTGDHSGRPCCLTLWAAWPMYCLSTDSGAPPTVRMQ